MGVPLSASLALYSKKISPATPPATNATHINEAKVSYAMKPNYAAHNLKKKTGKQHITGHARATQIMIGISEVSTMFVGACCHS